MAVERGQKRSQHREQLCAESAVESGVDVVTLAEGHQLLLCFILGRCERGTWLPADPCGACKEQASLLTKAEGGGLRQLSDVTFGEAKNDSVLLSALVSVAWRKRRRCKPETALNGQID